MLNGVSGVIEGVVGVIKGVAGVHVIRRGVVGVVGMWQECM